MSLPCLPQNYKIVEAIEPKTDAAGTTGDYVSLKNVHMAFIRLHITQGNAATIAISVNQATAVLPSDAVAITALFPIWVNADCAASDTLVRQADAANFTTDAGVKHKQVIFQIDPRILSAGFDCIAVVTGASNAGNIVEAEYLLYERYQAATPPAAITD
jgi:hypothetical protein